MNKSSGAVRNTNDANAIDSKQKPNHGGQSTKNASTAKDERGAEKPAPTVARPSITKKEVPKKQKGTSHESSPTAVIIEDSALMILRYRQLLDSLGCRVLATAKDGATGARLVMMHQPDIVVMDYEMPETNGLEATKMIRQSGCQSRIIVVSGTLSLERTRNLILAGANEVLVKPLNAERFSKAIGLS